VSDAAALIFAGVPHFLQIFDVSGVGGQQGEGLYIVQGFFSGRSRGVFVCFGGLDSVNLKLILDRLDSGL
jgi:hypothetical protein